MPSSGSLETTLSRQPSVGYRRPCLCLCVPARCDPTSPPAPAAVGEKRPEGLALLPSGVRPASWMEGAAWTQGKGQMPAELSCRALPAFTDTGPPLTPLTDLAAPSPYATTALLDTARHNNGQWGHRSTQQRSVGTPPNTTTASGNTAQHNNGQWVGGHRPIQQRSVGVTAQQNNGQTTV